MLITELYTGQGLGNQLACYVTTRVLALDLNYEFGVMHPERFKGANFMKLDFGKKIFGGSGPEGGPPHELPNGIDNYVREKESLHLITKVDIRDYDLSLFKLADNTKLDGLLQGEKYISHRKLEIDEWLKVDEKYNLMKYSDPNICVINFRGGEYTAVHDFYLSKTYWDNAILRMLEIKPNIRFIVITDDIKSAGKFFPNFSIFHFTIGEDYSVIKNAYYLILSNSSFAWFPAWLNKNLIFCIAPKYWGRHNVSNGYWSLKTNITSGWHYLDREGYLHDYNKCILDLISYEETKPVDSIPLSLELTNENKFKMKNIIKKIAPEFIINTIKFGIDYYRSTSNSRLNFANYILHNYNLLLSSNDNKIKYSIEYIKESKSKLLIYDVFYFFNELDLLEIRLNILDEFVDYFVLIEGSHTFGGNSKESYYKNNMHRFSKWNHKIIYHLIENFSDDNEILELANNHPNTKFGVEHWVNEFYFKESAKKAISFLNDSDIVFVSDLDEIWNPYKLIELTNFKRSKVNRPIQLSYYYYLNNRSNEHRNGWTGTISCKYETIKNNCLNDLRSRHITNSNEIENGGWHFTYLGGVEGARKKLVDQNHPEYNKYISTIEERVLLNVDYSGRSIKLWKDESDLPEYLIKNKIKWRSLFKDSL
jgi:hypothetical protein